MHQIFYIDSDEEISSVVDRLRKSVSTDNYFVVPKHALVLQSIVNLKLLKREGEKNNKDIIIVTQDELGLSIAKRAGISVQQTLDGVELPSDQLKNQTLDKFEDFSSDEEDSDDEDFDDEGLHDTKNNKSSRLSGVGSNDFYEDGVRSHAILKPVRRKELASDKAVVAVNGIKKASDHLAKKSISATTAPRRGHMSDMMPMNKRPNDALITESPRKMPSENHHFEHDNIYLKIDPKKDEVLEKMFSKKVEAKNLKSETKVINNKKFGKIIFSFLTVSILIIISIAAYLFIPSAKIKIVPNVSTVKNDAEIIAKPSGQVSGSEIESSVIDFQEKISLPYKPTGTAASSSTKSTSQKAHGSVVIYNEYDGSPQTLVENTRLESADGKIFHIVKQVIVPGSSSIGGEVKPGAIMAEVIADQVGTQYNIDPTTFTIPGFKDSPKYAKFYAKSTQPMNGGLGDAPQGGTLMAISQSDVSLAKEKTEAAIKKQIIDSISKKLKDGEISPVEAQKINIISSAPNLKIGSAAETFNYDVVADVHAIVFSENDVRKNLLNLAQNGDQAKNTKMSIAKIDYGSIQPNFDQNSLDIKVHGEILLTPEVDIMQIKNDLLGKDSSQLESFLKRYSNIKSASVEFQPNFVTRIPQYSARVSIELTKDGQ